MSRVHLLVITSVFLSLIMLTEIYYPAAPFPGALPEDLVGWGWGVHDGTGGKSLLCSEKWASSHHPQNGGSSCLLIRGWRRDGEPVQER